MNLRTFQGCMEFKDFSRTPSKIQGLFKTVRTLKLNCTGIEGMLDLILHFSPFPETVFLEN